MSENVYTPFLEFVPNQILKASDLNSMQERISQAIKESGAIVPDGSNNPNLVYVPAVAEWETTENNTVTFEVPYLGHMMTATKISDLVLNKEQLKRSKWLLNFYFAKDTFQEFDGSDAGIMFENEDFIVFVFTKDTSNTNGYVSVSKSGIINIEVEGQIGTVEVPEAGLYQIWSSVLSSGFKGKVEYTKFQQSNFTQSNYEQNDYRQPDFIKNRIAYSYNTPFKEEEIFNNESFGVTSPSSYTKEETIVYFYQSKELILHKPLELNKNYRIVFNGEEYLVKAAFMGAGLTLGNGAITQDTTDFDPNLPFCLGTSGNKLVVSLSTQTEQCSLKIYTTDIVLPKKNYEFSSGNALFIPGVYFVKNNYISDPMSSLNLESSYEITFDGVKYFFDLNPISLMDLVWGYGCGNSNLNDLINGKGVPFILASTDSVMADFYKMMEGLPPEGLVSKAMDLMITLEFVNEFPSLLFAVGETGSHEIEIREIPKNIKTISKNLLPKNQPDWKNNDKDSTTYIKNRPCYSYVEEAKISSSGSSDNLFIYGTAPKVGNQFGVNMYSLKYSDSIFDFFNKLLDNDYYCSVNLNNNSYITELSFFGEMTCFGNFDLISEPMMGKKISDSELPFLAMFDVGSSSIIIYTKEDLGEEIECNIIIFPETISPLHPKFLPTYELTNVFTSDISLPNTTYSGNFDNDEAMFTGYSFESVLKKGLVSISFNFNDGTNTIPLTLYLTNVRYQDGNHYVTTIHLINDKLYAFYFNIYGSTIECSYKEIGGTT